MEGDRRFLLYNIIKESNNEYINHTLLQSINIEKITTLNSDKVSRTRILIAELSAIEKDIWNIFEDVEEDTVSTLSKFIECFCSPTTNYSHLLENESTFTQLDALIPSIDDKYAKNNRLRSLKNLKLMLLSNLKALSLIHNWEDIISTANDTINSYKNLNKGDEYNGRSSLFYIETEGFDLMKLQTVKDTLNSLRSEYDSNFTDMTQFDNIRISLNILTDQYYLILKDLTLGTMQSIVCDELSECGGLTFLEFIKFYIDLYDINFDDKTSFDILFNDIKHSMSEIFICIVNSDADELSSTGLNISGHRAELDLNLIKLYLYKILSSFIASKSKLKAIFDIIQSKYSIMDADNSFKEVLVHVIEYIINAIGPFDDIDDLQSFNNINEILNAAFLHSSEQITTLDISNNLVFLNIHPMAVLDNCSRLLYNNAMSYHFHHTYENSENISHCADPLSTFQHSVEVFYDDVKSRLENKHIVGIGLDWLYIYIIVYKINIEYNSIIENISRHISNYFFSYAPDSVSSLDTESSLKQLSMALSEINSKILTNINNMLLLDQRSSGVVAKILYNRYYSSRSFLEELPLQYRNAIVNKTDLIGEFTSGESLIKELSSYISNLISKRAFHILSSSNPEFKISYSNTMNNYVSLPLQRFGEYYISLLPLYSDSYMHSSNILQSSFSDIIGKIREIMVQSEPDDPKLLARYQTDIEYLIKIGKICNVNVESLETMISNVAPNLTD